MDEMRIQTDFMKNLIAKAIGKVIREKLEEERERMIRQLEGLKMFGIDASNIIDQMKK